MVFKMSTASVHTRWQPGTPLIHCSRDDLVIKFAPLLGQSLNQVIAELDVGRVHPWIGLGWVTKLSVFGGSGGLGRVQCQKCLINVPLMCKNFVDYNS